MSLVRDLIFRPVEAAEDVPGRPGGVPEGAEFLDTDVTAPSAGGHRFVGWRWSADAWASAAEVPAGWTHVRVPAEVVSAPLPFVVTDVDSTLIQDEVIELLAAHAGRQAEVAEVTERAMRGELDFAASLHARVEVLRDLPVSVLDAVVAAVRPTPGAVELVRAVRGSGGHVYAVSGGFSAILAPLAQAWGLSGHRANELEVAEGRLTGRVAGDVVDRAMKAAMLQRWAQEAGLSPTVAVGLGDGANDIDLLGAAGLPVSVHGKPALVEVAAVDIRPAHLSPVQWMLGL